MNTKKLTLFIFIFLNIYVPIQGMEPFGPKAMASKKEKKTHTTHEKQALWAKKYNNIICPLTSLPKEVLINIFSHCLVKDEDQIKSLKSNMKRLMKMNTVCKKFNDTLTFKAIGKLCKHYTQDEKENVLENLMGKKINWPRNQIKFLPTLILICAGAKEKFKSLLTEAVWANDIQLATTLFKHHADPNMKNNETPIFFEIETIEMAQLFNDNKVNIHATDQVNQNVLWYLMFYNNASEPTNFYLAHGVNAKGLNANNDCLLHELAQWNNSKECDIDIFLKNATILLEAIPDMINTINIFGETPLDIAQKSFKESLENAKRFQTETPKAFEQLIALFQEYRGKTGKEILQASMILLLHNDDHLGELSLLPHDVRKYIVQYINALSKQIK